MKLSFREATALLMADQFVREEEAKELARRVKPQGQALLSQKPE